MSSRTDEPVVSRIIRLNQMILGKGLRNNSEHHMIHRDGLLDALFALYDECNTKHMKKNIHVTQFLEKVKTLIEELKCLRVSVSDFEVKKIIGRGNFGEVQVVKEKATSDVYAMKILRKAETLAHQGAAFYEEERDIMAKSNSPWLTKLQYAFQDSQNLYFIMEFHPGGDMLTLLEKYTVLSDEMARFYLAELVLAIHSVHLMGYAHRDVKPDNILIDRTGHIKLADFGSASKIGYNKKVTSKMPVGTPDYIAPEVLISMNDGQNSRNGYGLECDWWSFGIVAYEMLFGVTPFANEKLLVVYNNIMNFKKSLKFPEDSSDVSEHFLDLIKRTLTDADERISYKELLAHPLFTEIDWNNIHQCVPPYVPTVNAQDDTSNFDDFDQDIRPSMSELLVKKEFSGKDLPFIGFTYVSPVETTTEKISGIDNNMNTTCDFDNAPKRKSVIQLQDKIAVLTANEESMKNEIQKLQSSVRKRSKKYESEICRLEDEIIALQADKKELIRLLRLEREDRVLTEKKASQILKCMKKRKRKQFMHAHYSTQGHAQSMRDENDCNLSILEQLEQALDTIENEDNESSSSPLSKSSISPEHSKQRFQNETFPFQPLNEEEHDGSCSKPVQKFLKETFNSDVCQNLEISAVISEKSLQSKQHTASTPEKSPTLPETLARGVQCNMNRIDLVNKSQQSEELEEMLSGDHLHIKKPSEQSGSYEELLCKLCELQGNIKDLEMNLKEEKKKCLSFEKEIKEKNSKVSELELDLRMLTREKTRAEDIVSSLRESSRELREKLKNAQKMIDEMQKNEEKLKENMEVLENSFAEDKKSMVKKIEMLESQKDIGHIYAKSQGEFIQMAKENEKLKWESNVNETECSRLVEEIESLKKQLATKKDEQSTHERAISTLKKTCTELEEQLREFEFLEKNWEAEFKAVEIEKKKFVDRIIALQEEITMKNSSLLEERQAKENMQRQLTELEEDLDNQQSLHEAELQALNDQVFHQKKVITDLESHINEIEKEISLRDHDTNITSREKMNLEDELILMKEESARHITQISSLKSSNFKLTQSLEDAMENQREMQNMIDQMHSDLESSEARFNHEKVKMHETISQQAKLIDFLQSKAELMERKKKGMLVPRLFGKKESPCPLSWNNVDGLEQERTRCRRLQDQLSQARAENLALKNELNQKPQQVISSQKNSVPVPMSPASRAVHSALTSSPTESGSRGSPLNVTHDMANKFMKLQGMKHRIPHRFTETLCMRGSKCAACLDSIHFGRPAAKCQECAVLCHTRCASSLPNTCGLPSGFIQHFKSAFHEHSDTIDSSSSDAKLEGWVRVPKNNKQGWERRYVCIVESVLYLFEDSDIQDPKRAVDSLDFALREGEIIVLSAVSPTELQNAAKSDLPFLLKVEYRPHTTCWPSRCLYLMADSFTDKQMWVSNLESLAEKYRQLDSCSSMNKSIGKVVLKLEGDSFIDILCTYAIEQDILLIGAVEGLFVVALNNHKEEKQMHHIDGIESVYQMTCVNDLDIFVFISGEERKLNVIRSETLNDSIREKSPLFHDDVNSIADIKDCHLFAIQESKSGNSYHLCCASAKNVTLFRWDSNENCFCKRKVIVTSEPCSCILFTKSSVIYGSDKFYELDLKNCTLEEFLDCTDASLAGLVYGVSHFRSFPISVFNVSPVNQPDEYLVCFHELGVFVDSFGQRTRSDDMKWSRLPLSFGYQAPYLFVTHFSSLEVVEILPRGKNEKNTHLVIEIPNPQYLGPAMLSGAVYVASCQDKKVEILCIEGNNSLNKQQETEKMNNLVSPSRNSSSCSKASGEQELDFSFSNSLIHSLDASSGDNLSVSSDGGNHVSSDSVSS